MPRPEAVRWRARKVGLDLSLRSRGVAQRNDQQVGGGVEDDGEDA